MASGLPPSPFAAAPQASLSGTGWGIQWSSAEGRWVAAAQPGARGQPGQETALQPSQDGQKVSLPAAGSLPEDSLGQLERVGSVGELSAASEAGHTDKAPDAGAPQIQQAQAQPDGPTDGELSRQNSAASEAALALDEQAGPSRAAAGPPIAAAAAEPGALSCMNSSFVEAGPGLEAGPIQEGTGLQRSASGGPSRYRGVIWHKSNSKWEARIYENGKQRFLGYYTSEEEAARVYDEAAARITGRVVNFPSLPSAAALGESLSRANSASDEPLEQDEAALRTSSRGRSRKKSSIESQLPAMKGSSKYRGVSWNSNCSKWRAQVWKGNDVRHLGYFDDEVAAAKAYDRAAVELRGPSAPTNFPVDELLSKAAAEDLAKLVPNEATQEEVDGVDSLFLGVGWDDAKGCWKAELWDGDGYDLLGHFDTEEAAARAYDRACLKLHGEEANTNFLPGDYASDMAAAALLDAVPLSALASPGASEAGASDDEDARRSELELSAMHALASISSDEAESFGSEEQGSAAARRGASTVPRGNAARHLSPAPQAPASAPPALRPAMSDPIERPQASGLRRRKSTRISDADAATAAAALAGLTGKAAARPSRSMSPDQSASAGASVGRRNSGRSGPVASDQAKSSAYKGVSWHKHSQKWYAYIQSGGKMRGLGYFDSQANAAKAYDAEARKVHGRKAVVNFRLSSAEIQWQPRNKRGMSNSSAETSCLSFGAQQSPEGSEQSASAGQPRMRIGQRNPSRASSGRSGRARSATPALERASSDTLSAEEEGARAAKPAARSRLAAESGFARMSTQRPASAAAEKPPAGLAPLNMAAIPPFQADRDGEGSPTESCMSMDSIPLRKRSRKPKHVYNAADVAPLQTLWKGSTLKPKKDAPELPKVTLLPAMDKPMVLRSKDGGRPKRSRTDTSPPPRPATSSGTEAEKGEPRTLYKGVTRLGKERKWVARVWVDSKQKTVGRYDSDVAAAQAYDRAILSLKGKDAVTNFPASMYGKHSSAAPGLQPFQSADAACTVSLPDAGVSGESDHPSPSRACNAPLPLFKSRQAESARRSPLGPSPSHSSDGVRVVLPGTKMSSIYRGVSWNAVMGKWMAVVWNPQDRKAQHIGNYRSEMEAARAYDAAVMQFGGDDSQLNFPLSPLQQAASGVADAAHAASKRAFQEYAAHLKSQTAQGSSPEQSGEQLTQASAYEQLATLLRANPNATPLIAQALHNMSQSGAPGQQGLVVDMAPEGASPRHAPPRDSSRMQSDPLQHPTGDDRAPSTRPLPAASGRSTRDLGYRPRNQQQPVMKNSSRFRGVSLNKASRKWEARIREAGKNHYLGSFTDEEAAAHAFDSAALAMRGPQAVCNFPREGPAAKVHTFGHAPARQIMVRASPDEPYHAVAPFSETPRPWLGAQQGGVQQLPVVEASPAKPVHFDRASGMWVAEQGEEDRASGGSQEPQGMSPRTAHASAEAKNNPDSSNKRAPFMADLGSNDVVAEYRNSLQRASSAQMETDEARLPGPGPGRRSSKFKGVSWAEAPLKWRTQIWTGTKVQYIGYYDDEVEAAKAYDRAILKFRGPGHHVNFPEEQYTAEEIASAPKVEPLGGEEALGPLDGSPRASAPGYRERMYESSPRARSLGQRDSLSPRQHFQPKAVPTGRAAPDSQVYHQGTSQFKGVSWAERSKKWRAQLWFGSKVNHLGFFEYEEEAARAYDAAARAIRGPQASTNFSEAGGSGNMSARTITTSGRPGDTSTVVEAIPRINVNPKGSSMYKGVRWHERNGKWEARIFDSAAQKQVSLGYYEKEMDAARAYDAESLRLRGPGGHVNLPESRALAEARPQAMDTGRAAPAGDAGDDKWAIKRPRGTNPAIERGDLDAIAAVAAVVASASRPNARARASRYRGVLWDEDSQNWAVSLSPGNGDGEVQRQLGLFFTEEAAACAYDTLALQLWGPATPINFHSQGVAALPEGSHIPKKPRTDSAAASRQSAARFVLDAEGTEPSPAAPPASSFRAASSPSAAPELRYRAADEMRRREDVASAAAASDLVDFFQSAAQRWQTPVVAGTAAGSAAQAPSDRPGVPEREAIAVAPASGSHQETEPLQAHANGVPGPCEGAATDAAYRVPVLAAIQSWQPSAGASASELGERTRPGAQLVPGNAADNVACSATEKALQGPQDTAAPQISNEPAAEVQQPASPLGKQPVPGQESSGLEQSAEPDQSAAAGSKATPALTTPEAMLGNAAAAGRAAKGDWEKATPNLITPPKEAMVPNAASRPFSADTM